MARQETNVDYDLLRHLVTEALPRFKSPRSVSLAATNNSNPDLVRNLLAGTDPVFPAVFGLCKTMDIPLASVIKGLPHAQSQAEEWLTVNGEVEAGIFRSQPEWGPEDWYQVEVDAVGGAGGHHGLVVKGRSMDRTLPPGTILRCVDVIGSGLVFRHDDYVIVERKRGDLVELTCKKLSQREDGSYDLIAESTLSEYRDPIFIGRPRDDAGGPGFDALTDDETRVRAIVIDAYLPLRRRRTRPMPEA